MSAMDPIIDLCGALVGIILLGQIAYLVGRMMVSLYRFVRYRQGNHLAGSRWTFEE